jgi:hypothetical protein
MGNNIKLNKLSNDELERVDKLLYSARKFHYSAFIISGISLILSSLDKIPEIKIPLGNFEIPSLQASIGIYILVLILIIASERLFNMAYPYMKIDNRRPPFAWIALCSKEITYRSILIWLLLPVLICAIATSNSLNRNDITGFVLSFVGIFIIFLPVSIDEYYYLIRKKLDHRGGPATFSMLLLYYYRLIRSIGLTIFFFIPILAVIPKWRNNLLNINKYIFFIWIIMFLIRFICCFPICYRFIDRVGSKISFPLYLKHYK